MSSFEDGEDGRLQDALSAVAETAVPREDCPEPERIWDAQRGALAPEETRTVVEHLASCTVCAEAWRLATVLDEEPAAGFGGADAAPDLDAAQDDRDEGSFWRGWLQVAALVAVLAGAGFLVRQGGPPDVVRSGSEPEIVALTPQDRPLSRDPLVLSWSSPEPGLHFNVEVTWVTAQRSTPIARATDLTETKVALPESALETVPSGAILLWDVTAVRDGEPVARQTFRARLE